MSLLIPLLATAIIAASGLDPKEADIAWTAEGEFCEPETVISLPDGQLLRSMLPWPMTLQFHLTEQSMSEQ